MLVYIRNTVEIMPYGKLPERKSFSARKTNVKPLPWLWIVVVVVAAELTGKHSAAIFFSARIAFSAPQQTILSFNVIYMGQLPLLVRILYFKTRVVPLGLPVTIDLICTQ